MKILKVFSRYGIIGTIKLLRDVAYTKLFFPQCRLIRLPIRIRNDSPLHLGKKMTSGVDLRIDAFGSGKIIFGDGIQINDYVHISSINSVEIGNNTLIASRVFISDHNHGSFDGNKEIDGPDTPPSERPLSAKPVHIGNNVWIGESVCILPGISIGDGSIIGAGSVVTKNIPSRCVAVGNPAKIVKRYFDENHEWKKI